MQTTRQILSDTSPAAASSAAGTSRAHGLADLDSLTVVASLVGATGGTLDVYLQTSHDGGTTWYDWAHFVQLTAGNAAIKQAFHQGRDNNAGVTTIGTAATPALAASTVVGGGWGDMMRLAFTAGVSTSAGAAISVQLIGNRNS